MRALEQVPVADDVPELPEVSIVLPCLDEARTVATCVLKARAALERRGVRGEVVVVDNGSSDDSAALAGSAGARVVHEPRRGYGAALMRGIEEARAPQVILADADDSYDLSELGPFLDGLRDGYDLVIGSRFRGDIRPGAMPWLHRRIGNPFLSGLLRLFFRGSVSDAHCGMRALTRDAYRRMQLRTTGMELASEMVVKALLGGLRIAEVPITLHRDGRGRRPHLRTFRDGWRHLRFMLLFSPTHLFLIPGGLCMLLGLVPLSALGGGPLDVAGFHFDVHWMVVGSLLTILGFQIALFGVFAKESSRALRLFAPDRTLAFFHRYFSLERGLALGGVLFLAGLAIDVAILADWLRRGMGSLDAVRPAIQASTLMILGAQTMFASFFVSLLSLDRRMPEP